MKANKLFFSFLICSFMIVACNNNNDTDNASSPGLDSTSNNPTDQSLDYSGTEKEHIPITDSSTTIGTDSVNGSTATPNTGTMKSMNDSKGNKDSMKNQK